MEQPHFLLHFLYQVDILSTFSSRASLQQKVEFIFKVYNSESNWKISFTEMLDILRDLMGQFISEQRREEVLSLFLEEAGYTKDSLLVLADFLKHWRNERIVATHDGGHITLVQDSDPFAQQNKDVVHMMEIEVGDGWIISNHRKVAKVYLFVSSQRIFGCLAVNPIERAYRILSLSKVKWNCPSEKEKRRNPNSLQFGGVSFQEEIIRRDLAKISKERCNGVILCEDEALPAFFDIRAIWVAPSHHRKHVASNLLDAARKIFREGLILEHNQIAFSQPTSLGKTLFCSASICVLTLSLPYQLYCKH